MTERFAGTTSLVRVILRLDRLRLTVWTVTLVGLVAWTAGGIQDLYTEPELAPYARTADGSPAIVALSGPVRGLDTYGGRTAFEVWQLALAFALFGVLAVTRHTRHEEEAGRTELVRAGVVGRHAGSIAAIAVAYGASMVIGVSCAVALAVQGLPTDGSVVLGLGLGAIGGAFAAVALLAAQITEHGRAATGVAIAVMGATYLARAIGDIGSTGLSWTSPFGWAQAAQPFTGDRWWPLAVALCVTFVVAAAALAVEAHRDVGAGLVAPRPGPAHADSRLRTPLGLAWRLQRATLLAWTTGAAVIGLAMGSIANSADDLIGDNEQIRDYLASVNGASLDDLFLATILAYLALLAAGFAVQSTLRLRSEELTSRGDAVLATGTSRRAWASSHLAIAFGGGIVVLVASAVTTGLGYALATHDVGQVPRLGIASMALTPAIAVAAAAAAATYGLRPRAAGLAWALLGWSVFVGMLGEGLGLPGSLVRLSPFSHVPAVPAEAVAWLPLTMLSVLTVALVLVSLAALARRDIG